jgi:hypothetical protein
MARKKSSTLGKQRKANINISVSSHSFLNEYDKKNEIVENKTEYYGHSHACKKNISSVGSSWEDVRKELFTPEELAESKKRVARMVERTMKK